MLTAVRAKTRRLGCFLSLDFVFPTWQRSVPRRDDCNALCSWTLSFFRESGSCQNKKLTIRYFFGSCLSYVQAVRANTRGVPCFIFLDLVFPPWKRSSQNRRLWCFISLDLAFPMWKRSVPRIRWLRCFIFLDLVFPPCCPCPPKLRCFISLNLVFPTWKRFVPKKDHCDALWCFIDLGVVFPTWKWSVKAVHAKKRRRRWFISLDTVFPTWKRSVPRKAGCNALFLWTLSFLRESGPCQQKMIRMLYSCDVLFYKTACDALLSWTLSFLGEAAKTRGVRSLIFLDPVFPPWKWSMPKKMVTTRSKLGIPTSNVFLAKYLRSIVALVMRNLVAY